MNSILKMQHDVDNMINVTIDFESYYDGECSLSSLSVYEYITHPLFHVIGMGIKINDKPAKWVTGEGVRTVLQTLPWERVRLIAHNNQFDAAIVTFIYGHRPREYYCTMMASRPMVAPFAHSMSLDKVSKYIHTKADKGTYVVNAKGKALRDFTAEGLADYGVYCITDVENCYEIYQFTSSRLSVDEHIMIHLTVQKAVEPLLELDIGMLEVALEDEIIRKELLLQRCGLTKETIMSNLKFAEALRQFGVEPPMKVSPTTGKQALAFAKTDQEFLDMLNHDNPDVRLLVEARLGGKSTIEESRLDRFIKVGNALKNKMHFALMYFAAHTGRMGGTDKLNMQNLTRGSALRRAIIAPPGYKIVTSDLSQIEARMVAWLAGQGDMLEDFRDPTRDVYCEFGSRVFGRQITKADKADRFVAKVGVLSLMYASGAAKFCSTVNISGQAKIDENTAQRVVDTYRNTYSMIKHLWRILDKMLQIMITGGTSTYKCLTFTNDAEAALLSGKPAPCVLLPDGRKIYYPELYVDGNNEKYYRGNKGHWKKIYGGAFLENLSQALAQIIIKEAELRTAAVMKYRVVAVGQVHDELIYCVPEAIAERFAKLLSIEMTRPPAWALDIPLECETGIGGCYADTK